MASDNPCARLAFVAALFVAAASAHAGDMWEITSASIGPDGTSIPYTQTQCLPANAMDPSVLLSGMGTCTFDQKSGNDAALVFSMTCKTPGMPAELASMRVTGDAKMVGGAFDMRYVIAAGPQATGLGSDFKMSGSARARKTGACNAQ